MLQSQDHRMVEVGKDLWIHLVQNVLQQGNQEQSSLHHVQGGFGDLQRGDTTTSLSNLRQHSITCTAQKCLLVFRGM